MSSEEKPALTRDQAALIIREASTEETVLVGGQAVVFWCERFDIPLPGPALTRDIDFYGGKEAVIAASEKLAAMNPRVYIASLDDATPNSGKIAVDLPGLEDACEIDFLYLVAGLGSMEVLEKAVPMQIDGVTINVIHPLLLLESKISNLKQIPEKRGFAGQSQAKLAVEVAKRFLVNTVGQVEPRQTLNMLKRVIRFSDGDEAKYAWYHFDIDTTAAVPLDALRQAGDPQIQRFLNEGWPVEEQRLNEHRERFRSIADRQKAYEASLNRPKGPGDNEIFESDAPRG
ncbi:MULTISPECIES: hypothetical protein [unclassified Burkholderia]|uniref:hypothetical protein n=1 Tax=unclassified Burkholderia TaxID=2613784 RepID=UPI002AB1EF85|nr:MULTISPECIES: hypothetical protein [unclassified Burkholderia]